MSIAEADIQRVRESTDLVALISKHLSLRKVGSRWSGLCPFHSEKTPSFSVNAEEGFYYCFGCSASGDAITFVREIEHLSFVEAVEQLASINGIVLTYATDGESERSRKRAKLHEAVESAVEFYHQRLLTGGDAGEARSYLRDRGYSADIVREFRIGWAPEGWDTLARGLGVPADVFVASGLGYRNKRGGLNDAFRSRVLFPIFDASGRALGFGGRKMPGTEGPKYKNSAESDIYAKSRVLYGLHKAKTAAVKQGRVIVCEGYTDVIAFHQAGLSEAVATCGTALTEDHIRLLRRFATRIVLAFDADSAGQAAASRVYAWEEQHEIEVSVVSLPAGMDPAELQARDPGLLVAAVDHAQPFLGFRVKRTLEAGDVTSPEGRARTAQAALSVVKEHPGQLVRDQYLMEVASFCHLPEETLREMLSGAPAPEIRPASRHIDASHEGPALEGLRLLAHNRDAIQGRMCEVMFIDEAERAAFLALKEAQSLHDAIERADPVGVELLRRIGVQETTAEVDDVLRLLASQTARRFEREYRDIAVRNDELDEYRPLLQWLQARIAQMGDEGLPLEERQQALKDLLEWLPQQELAA